MKKIVLGIVVMAVLLGGLGAGFIAGYDTGYIDGSQDKEAEGHEAFDEVFRQGVYEGYCQCVDIAESEYGEFDPQTDGVCYAFRQEYVFPCTDQLTNFWVSYVDTGVHSRVEYWQPEDYKIGGK